MASAETHQEPWWRPFSRTNGLLAIVLLAGTIVLLIQQSTWLLGSPEILYGSGRDRGYMVSNRFITSMLLVSVVLIPGVSKLGKTTLVAAWLVRFFAG